MVKLKVERKYLVGCLMTTLEELESFECKLAKLQSETIIKTDDFRGDNCNTYMVAKEF